MPGLIKSLKRSTQYQTGGVLAVLAIPTLLASGAKGFTVTRDAITGAVTAVTPAVGNDPQLIEPEENSCSWAENLKVAANRYLLQQLSFKYGGLSQVTAEGMKLLNLNRHSFLVKLKTGVCVLLGENNGLTVEKNDGGAGASNDDLAGYDLTFSGAEIVHVAIVPVAEFDRLAGLVND